MLEQLSYFLKKFSRLKLGHSKGAPAPHKPILLLSIIQGIEAGEIIENRIYITPELVSRFKDLFRVFGGSFVANFSLPFYHLKSSGFWHLQTHPGKEILLTKSLSIRSFAHLKEVVAYASLDDVLFALLLQPDARDALKQCLLQTYFWKQQMPLSLSYSLFEEVRTEILEESPVAYRQRVEAADEEEIFVRSGVFKKVIPQLYNYTCAISGMRIIASWEVQMVDACHIVPFAESHDDTVGNGISLCPNLHRAFDRFLVSVDADYKVVVSESFLEEKDNYPIRVHHGKQILLPENKRYLPSPENLHWHYQRFLSLQSSYQ